MLREKFLIRDSTDQISILLNSLNSMQSIVIDWLENHSIGDSFEATLAYYELENFYNELLLPKHDITNIKKNIKFNQFENATIAVDEYLDEIEDGVEQIFAAIFAWDALGEYVAIFFGDKEIDKNQLEELSYQILFLSNLVSRDGFNILNIPSKINWNRELLTWGKFKNYPQLGKEIEEKFLFPYLEQIL